MKVVEDEDGEVSRGEVGEIVTGGHNVMRATRPARRDRRDDPRCWFQTRDMARVDADGYLFIVDRNKDMVIRGGYSLYPGEVEEILYQHPAGPRSRRDRYPA